MKPYFFGRTLLVLCSAFALISCNSDDNDCCGPVPQDNIVQIAEAEEDLSTLVAALDRAGLRSTLEGGGPFTVLAPTDAAFTAFLGTAGFSSIDEVPEETLRQILLNHVIGSQISSSILTQLQRNYTQTLAEGPSDGSFLSLYFDATSGIEFNGVSSVVNGFADIAASNGTIHVVDAVIDLPTLVTFATVDQNFEELTTALTTASPNTDFVSTLQGAGPFTIFAPADQAFQDLLDSNPDWTTLADIDESFLTAVLLHHVVAGNVRGEDFSQQTTMLETLEGDDITVTPGVGAIAASITDGMGNTNINVGVVNIQANNGVIHIIDEVMIPDTEN